MSLLLLEGDLLVGLVGVPVTSSWKIVKGPGLLLRGACEVVLELAISGVEEKVAIRKGPYPSWVWPDTCVRYLVLELNVYAKSYDPRQSLCHLFTMMTCKQDTM